MSASRLTDADTGTGRRAGGFAYVQGSGDDHELWGMVSLSPRHRLQGRADDMYISNVGPDPCAVLAA